jgi:hypothetical protein
MLRAVPASSVPTGEAFLRRADRLIVILARGPVVARLEQETDRSQSDLLPAKQCESDMRRQIFAVVAALGLREIRNG